MKPGDFFLGIIDFFAVLVPGAAAAFFVIRIDALQALTEDLGETPRWVAFAVLAYLLGQLLFLVSSLLDSVYDHWRDRQGNRDKPDVAYAAASSIQRKHAPSLPPRDDGVPSKKRQSDRAKAHYSTFKWAKAVLRLRAPEARADVDRLEASSKLFRGLVVFFAGAVPYFLWSRSSDHPLALALVCAGLSVACFAGFYNHRWKSTELAFAYVVLVTSQTSEAPTATDDEPASDDD